MKFDFVLGIRGQVAELLIILNRLGCMTFGLKLLVWIINLKF